GGPPVPPRGAQLLQPRTDVGLRRHVGSGCRQGVILLHVIARGKIARSPEAELVERYRQRIAWDLKLTELPEKGGRVPEALSPVRTVLLDERGRDLSSEELAAQLEKWRDGGI